MRVQSITPFSRSELKHSSFADLSPKRPSDTFLKSSQRLPACLVCTANTHVEYTEQQNQEASAPASLEANSDHDARAKAENGNDDSCDAPVTLDDEADEEEDEQNATGKL